MAFGEAASAVKQLGEREHNPIEDEDEDVRIDHGARSDANFDRRRRFGAPSRMW